MIAGSLAAVMIASTMTGCSSVIGTDAKSYPLTAALTQQEVLDYYAKSMAYDTVVSRSAEANINNYEVKEVTNPEKKKALEKALSATEDLLSADSYVANETNSNYLSASMYNYIRAMLNDKKLTNSRIVAMNQALGYYFLDVEYDISAAPIGTFTDAISLVGMSGSFSRSGVTGEDSVNVGFLQNAQSKLNNYFTSKIMTAKAVYSGGSSFSMTGLNKAAAPDYSSGTVTEPSIPGVDGIEAIDAEPQMANAPLDAAQPNETGDTTPDETGDSTTGGNETDGIGDVTEPNEPDTTEPVKQPEVKPVIAYTPRTTGIDLDLFTSVVGFGSTKAYIPKLSMVYNTPVGGNGISGVGIYPSGGLGLSIFGFNRNNLTGTCTIRYLYKENLTNPNLLSCANIYVNYYEITSGFSANNDNIIPEFLSEEFEILVERADRAMVNCDINGLANGSIFSDVGMAVLQGYTEEYGNLIRQISTVRRIISRDIENNAYLVEIESYKQEGDEGSDLYPSYKDMIYAVIEQKGSEFVITDWMTMTRQLVNEPDINPDSSTAKRVVSLGLTGSVSDDTKSEVTELINSLYDASSRRILTGPVTLKDGTVIEKGMYDCFDSNVEMLPSTRKEELNAKIRELLVKYGTNTSATMRGTVTEWIGGTSNQVEFTTEEVITYQGRTDGVYMTCYYLVSCMEDVWVIDDIQILDQEELSGDGLSAVVARIG